MSVAMKIFGNFVLDIPVSRLQHGTHKVPPHGMGSTPHSDSAQGGKPRVQHRHSDLPTSPSLHPRPASSQRMCWPSQKIAFSEVRQRPGCNRQAILFCPVVPTPVKVTDGRLDKRSAPTRPKLRRSERPRRIGARADAGEMTVKRRQMMRPF